MRTFLGVALCVALAACGSVKDKNGPDGGGGGDDDDDQSGDFTLSVDPGSIDVPIASSGMVTVMIDRTGSLGDVTLSAEDLPTGITATFEPNPVSTSSSTVTLAVAGGSAAGTSTVTIVGTAGSVRKTATVTVNAKTINVAGTVRGGPTGVTVRLVGKPAVTTGTGGTFMFTDVTPPYDLYVIGTGGSVIFGGTYPAVNYYKGLTRPDPSVSQPLAGGFIILTMTSNGTVSGTRSGGSASAPLHLVWDSGGVGTASPPTTYSFSASWPQAATHSGVLYGYQFTAGATGSPNGWPGIGNTNATLSANATTTVNLSLTPPTTAELTGEITSPTGFPMPSLQLTQQLGQTSTLVWSGTTTTADATIPVINAGKSCLSASATVGGASTSFVDPALNATKDVTFALIAPPVQNAPLESAVGVNKQTPFTWTSTPSTVYQVGFFASGSAAVGYTVFTSEATATLPDVPEVALPSNQAFSWSVTGRGPNASVNDAASQNGLLDINAFDFTGTRHFVTSSTSRAFTTGS